MPRAHQLYVTASRSSQCLQKYDDGRRRMTLSFLIGALITTIRIISYNWTTDGVQQTERGATVEKIRFDGAVIGVCTCSRAKRQCVKLDYQ